MPQLHDAEPIQAPYEPLWGDPDDVTWLEEAKNLGLELPPEEPTLESKDLSSITADTHNPNRFVNLEHHQPRLVKDVLASAPPAGDVGRIVGGNVAIEPAERPAKWWVGGKFHTIQRRFREPIFSEVPPSEEFIVGQETGVVRIFKFGESLSAERQKDCRRFVDIVTQFMGDRAYDFISDIVIGDFVSKEDGAEKDEHDSAGFGYPDNGIILVNTATLPDDAPRDVTAEGSAFLQTLVHEFGHLLHGDIRNDPQARSELEEFAATIGWGVEEMRKDGHDWAAKGVDNRPYAPYSVDPDLPELSSPGGSPTEYGTKTPQESLGDTNKHMMLGSTVTNHMARTHDAWLEYLQKRMLKPGEVPADRPIATRLDRTPINITRYTGGDIRYPSYT